jgi:hypothetical protein
MATDQPTIPLGIEQLNIAAVAFHEQADAFRAIAATKHTVAENLDAAAVIAHRLASLRFIVAEIADRCTDKAPDIARDLRAALDAAAVEV